MTWKEALELTGATIAILGAGGSFTVWTATMISSKIASRLRDEIVGSPKNPSILQPIIDKSMADFKVTLGDYLNGKYIRRRECEITHTETDRRLSNLEDES